LADTAVRLAYADPPYPGKAHLYPENEEVDHAELIAALCEYDGWALSTDERSLRFVLGLCPPEARILAWCRKNVPPLLPNPIAAWEPVILSPARKRPAVVRSYCETEVPSGVLQRDGITGQKSLGFCEWVIRCLGADPDDTLDDLFPGTGIMGEAWRRWVAQPELFVYATRKPTGVARANREQRWFTSLPGMEGTSRPERSWRRL
jgi:hypothetical protein